MLDREPAALLDLWSADPIALPPDGPNLAGRAAIDSMLSTMNAEPDSARAWRTVDYVQSFSAVHVIEDGDWGWDLGTARTILEHQTSGRRIAVTARLLRILQRSPSGEWKVHRSMWSPGETDEFEPVVESLR